MSQCPIVTSVTTYNVEAGDDGEGRVGGGLAEVLPPVLQPHSGDRQLPALKLQLVCI